MNVPTVGSLYEILSGGFAVAGGFYAFLSLKVTYRPYGIRVAGICFLMALAFAAHSPWTYFAAVFIIGTLITELEFLQNLAAIIRGDKNYFEYLKEARGQVVARVGAAPASKALPEGYRGPMEYKILQTLWTKQVNKWPDMSVAFTFRINRQADEFLRFREAGNKLMGEGLISETENGQFFLTHQGFDYCKHHYKEFPPDQWWPEELINKENLAKVTKGSA